MISSAAAKRVVAGLALALLAVLLLPTSASAHAVLVGSDPVDGARVATSPTRVRLAFDERVGIVPGASIVLAQDGTRVDTGRAAAADDGRVVLLPLRPGLPRGVYTVSWRVVSADSHVVTGSIRFGVGQEVGSAPATAAAGSSLDGAAAAASGLVDGGAVLLAGVPLAALLVWPSIAASRRMRRLVLGGAFATGIGTTADLLLRGPRATGSGWVGVLRFDDLGGTLGGVAGIVLLTRLVLVAGCAAAAARAARRPSSRVRVAVLFAAALALFATIAVLGHAAATSAAVWLVPVAVLHLLGMGVWLGGLAVLVGVLLPRLRPRGLTRWAAVPAARVLRPWTRVAFASVALLIVTGEVQGLQTVAPLESLWTTGYGLLLLGKLLLVAVALAFALGSHRLVLPGDGRRPSFSALRRSVVVEAVATAAVVAVTAALAMQPTALETYGPAVAATTALGPDRADVRVDATRLGPTAIHVRVRDGGGRDRELESLSGSLSADGVPGLGVRFRRAAGGWWVSTDAQAPVRGLWLLTLQISVDRTHGYATSAAWTVW